MITLGVRGLLYVDLSVETLPADAHSGLVNLLPNAPWRLVWALASLKDAGERVLIPGFYTPCAIDPHPCSTRSTRKERLAMAQQRDGERAPPHARVGTTVDDAGPHALPARHEQVDRIAGAAPCQDGVDAADPGGELVAQGEAPAGGAAVYKTDTDVAHPPPWSGACSSPLTTYTRVGSVTLAASAPAVA